MKSQDLNFKPYVPERLYELQSFNRISENSLELKISKKDDPIESNLGLSGKILLFTETGEVVIVRKDHGDGFIEVEEDEDRPNYTIGDSIRVITGHFKFDKEKRKWIELPIME